MLGVVSLQQKTGTQCGAYGWWLVPQKHKGIQQQQHVGWPAANLKVIQKSSPFHKTTPVNIQLFSSSQQADFGSALHHHTAPVQHRRDHVLEGSAHITLGDARGGIKDQEQFLQRLDNSDNEGTHRSLPKKSGHLQNEGETDQDDSRETLTLCSGHFVVPGAHDFDWVLGAPNFVKSA